MRPAAIIGCFVIWSYILWTLKRSGLFAFRFLWGSMGLFVLLMMTFQPLLTQPLARAVSALAGIFGSATGIFTAYFKYGIIFIASAAGTMTMQVDFECSGIIEIMAFLSLLAFFDVYTPIEKVITAVGGTFYMILCNSLRIILICTAVYLRGPAAYYVVHTFIAKIFFYCMSVILYFYVFTKPQVIKMKVGNFTYEHHGDHA